MSHWTWRCEAPKNWVGTDGTNTASAHKVREGCLYGSDWMWTTHVNGEWIDNANTLADAKASVRNHSKEQR